MNGFPPQPGSRCAATLLVAAVLLAVCARVPVIAGAADPLTDLALSRPAWEVFRLDLVAYKSRVEAVARTLAPADTNDVVQTYLTGCIQFAGDCLGAVGDPSACLRHDDVIAGALDLRRALDVRLRAAAQQDHPAVRLEQAAYAGKIQPHLQQGYLGRLRARGVLWQEKGVADWDPESGNRVESWLNTRCPLTRFDARRADTPPRYGVSRWELTVQAEPVVLLSGANDAAVLLDLGLLYNLLPDVRIDPDSSPRVTRGLLSRGLDRVGFRAGGGMAFGDKLRGCAAAGLQLRVWTVWGVYEPTEEAWSVAVGLSDWEWVKEILPAFVW